MLEFLKIFGISYLVALGIYLVFLFILKLLNKSTQDVKRWLANFLSVKITDFIMEFFTFILASILYVPIKNFLYTPSTTQVKEMVLDLYKNSPSFLNKVLEKQHKNLSDAISDIKVLYIKKINSNNFKAFVRYKFVDFQCEGTLDINVIQLNKYFFKFDKVNCEPVFLRKFTPSLSFKEREFFEK